MYVCSSFIPGHTNFNLRIFVCPRIAENFNNCHGLLGSTLSESE